MNADAMTSNPTTEELFALPEDANERDIVRGKLRVYPHQLRDRWSAETLTAVSRILGNWNRSQVGQKGEVAASNVGVRLSRNPETFIGIDATYYSAASLIETPSNQKWYEGPPVLAVEIWSPSDTHGEVVEKINLCLESRVQVVWILDPDFQTLTVYRSGTVPLMLRSHETLVGHPELPGLSVPVRDFFN